MQYVFDVDGKSVYPSAYMSYCPEQKNIDACKEKGIQLFMFPAYAGEEEVYVIPRVCVEPPKWWQQKYPEEVARDFRGESLRECFASQKWREDMMTAVKALICSLT